jgi:hypothetical protein
MRLTKEQLADCRGLNWTESKYTCNDLFDTIDALEDELAKLRNAKLEAAEKCLGILNDAVEYGNLRKRLEAYVAQLRVKAGLG